MEQREKIPSIRMIRPTLEDIPVFDLPDPYQLRRYRPGDAANWVRIHQEADVYNEIRSDLFPGQFGSDEEELAARQFYLCDGEGQAVGTATAWYNNDFRGERYGQVHWVAIVPEHQGKGLAKPLMTAVLRRLRELGHDRVYLSTNPPRLPAIHLYMKFGFVPMAQTEQERSIWEEVHRKLAAGR